MKSGYMFHQKLKSISVHRAANSPYKPTPKPSLGSLALLAFSWGLLAHNMLAVALFLN